jgi:glycosyltransferase involved in cell wall biosynthesis
MKISLCMIVKNEERFIVNCLKAAIPLVDEIIIVDTGSTDNTITLINECRANIELRHFFWTDNFADARNESIRGAIGDWILPLDADEVIHCNPVALRAFLETAPEEGLLVAMNHHLGTGNFHFGTECVRFFRNKHIIYEGALHEKLVKVTSSGNLDDNLSTGVIDEKLLVIDHYGYAPAVVNEKNKRQRNKTILQTMLLKSPGDPALRFYLGKEFAAEGNYEEALNWLLAVLPELKTNLVRRTAALQEIVMCYFHLKRYNECIHFIEALLTSDQFATPFFLFYLAGSYHNSHMYEKAMATFGRCLEVKAVNQVGQAGLDSYLPKLNMARICAENNIPTEATLWYIEAVFDKKNTTFFGKDEARDYFLKINRLDIVNNFDQALAMQNPT